NIVSNGRLLQAGASVQTGSGLTIINNREYTDPGLVNPTGFDFHLLASSLAIDAGVSVPVPTDFEGRTRPQGNGYDIGAYEHSSLSGWSQPHVSSSSIAFNATSVKGSSSSKGAVTLTGAAPSGGAVAPLLGGSIATAPAGVTIPAGASGATSRL